MSDDQTPKKLSDEALEQLKRDYEEPKTEAKYVFPDPSR